MTGKAVTRPHLPALEGQGRRVVLRVEAHEEPDAGYFCIGGELRLR